MPGLLASAVCFAQTSPIDAGSWPKGASPQEIGQRVAEHFVTTAHGDGIKARRDKIIYPEMCAWYGALTFAQLTGNKELTAKLTNRFEPLFAAEANLVPPADNEDDTSFGAVPLEIYIETKQPRYLDMGKGFADKQWAPTPQGTRLSQQSSAWIAQGLSWQSRFWIDDMYMITILEVQAYRATGDAKYIDRAALEMTAYLDQLQQTNGLFYHALDVHYYWGRGNGWVAAGMSELLRSLPKDHPKRARILEGYQKMMASLLQFQGDDGMWHQLLDHPESFKETSCTAMFTFAFITGVKNGWLDEKTYGPAARKGWLALVSYIDDKAEIREVCDGTNRTNDMNFYLTRTRSTGNLHGQAPVMWCASAWLRPPQ
jgi:rhamnogalacturonyl hydrolase YesR